MRGEDPVGEEFAILIADRNRHVREFLKRELTQEGYRIETAGDGREVLMRLEDVNPPELLILDLEMPFLGGLEIVEWLRARRIAIPIVVHSFPPENSNHGAIEGIADFVEKRGDNIVRLKETIRKVLRTKYPQRFPEGDEKEPKDSNGLHPPT